jgi:hypothetical protein
MIFRNRAGFNGYHRRQLRNFIVKHEAAMQTVCFIRLQYIFKGL